MGQLKQGTHGGEVLRIAREQGLIPEDFLDVSNNANTLVADLTRELLAEIPYPFLHYPENSCAELRQSLAAYEGLGDENLLVGNGSSECLYLALQALRPQRVLLLTPLFSEYARACEALGIAAERHVLREEIGYLPDAATLKALEHTTADLVILCTPNNPTCAVFEDLPGLLRHIRAPYCLVDTAYKEFVFGNPNWEKHFYRNWAAKELRTRPIALNSFTKYFCCTGLRLGYLAAAPEVIEQLQAVRPPWMVSRFAELAGLRFLEQLERYRQRGSQLESAREQLVGLLRTCGLFDEVRSGPVNFVLCRLHRPEQGKILASALEQKQILVRLCDNIPGMAPGYFRIQVRTPDENLRAAAALSALAGS